MLVQPTLTFTMAPSKEDHRDRLIITFATQVQLVHFSHKFQKLWRVVHDLRGDPIIPSDYEAVVSAFNCLPMELCNAMTKYGSTEMIWHEGMYVFIHSMDDRELTLLSEHPSPCDICTNFDYELSRRQAQPSVPSVHPVTAQPLTEGAENLATAAGPESSTPATSQLSMYPTSGVFI